jgi:tRNA(Met) C34 N-acetyltransferase TmcA
VFLKLLTPELSIPSLTKYQVRLYLSTSLALLTLCVLVLTSEELSFLFTPFDLKRIESYAQNSLDYHVILDLLPTLAILYFEERLGEGLRLSAIQSSILLGMGLQRKSVEAVEVRSHPTARPRTSSCPHVLPGGTPAACLSGTRTLRKAYS